MERIKVAMLTPYLDETGSVPMHVRKLAYYLSQRDDIELHIITIGNGKETTQTGNLIVHAIKQKYPYPLAFPILVRLLKRKIQEIKPDIVNAQTTNMPYSTTAAFVRHKYPAVLTVRGILVKEARFITGIGSIFNTLFHKPNEKYVVSRIPDIIAVSSATRNVISSMSNSVIHVIRNGADFEDMQNVELCESVRSPSILFVGHLAKIKGVNLLLEAIPIIKKVFPDVHVYIAGSGPDEGKLRKLVQKLNIEENVEFLGFVQGDLKYSYYKSADIFVLPSLWDSAPVVLPQAMICGRPIVASNVGGIPDMVENGETGVLFEPGNVEQLAEKLTILLQDRELREEMGKAGAERVKEFTWEKIAERTVGVYREILRQG